MQRQCGYCMCADSKTPLWQLQQCFYPRPQHHVGVTLFDVMLPEWSSWCRERGPSVSVNAGDGFMATEKSDLGSNKIWQVQSSNPCTARYEGPHGTLQIFSCITKPTQLVNKWKCRRPLTEPLHSRTHYTGRIKNQPVNLELGLDGIRHVCEIFWMVGDIWISENLDREYEAFVDQLLVRQTSSGKAPV